MALFTDTLAQFVIDTRAADIPDQAFDAAQAALTDTVGVALAGTREPVGEIALRWVQAMGARPDATVWGHGAATSLPEAVFANGLCSHALDFDDSHPGARGHASATLVPAALTTAEHERASGEAVLAAYAVGLEIGGKLGRAFGPGHLERGWHPTATVGIFSATAAAARLMKLDVPGLRRAWGIAASQAGGLVRNFGTMAKPFHAGHAARCAVVSASLARFGLTADEALFDGKGGVLATYGGAGAEAPDALLQRLGRPWEILDPGNYLKRWPCCYSSHRAIGGLLALVEENRLELDQISEVAVGFLPGGDTALVSRDPKTGLEGKFSVEYALAAMLIDRSLTLETFTDAMVQRPHVRELMRRVRRYVIPDDKLYSGIAGHLDVTVRTPRGRFERRVREVPGSAAWPMTEADREAKFIDCAGRALGTRGAEALLEIARRCRALPDIAPLVRATVPPALLERVTPALGAR